MPKVGTGLPRGRPPGTINKRSAEMVDRAVSSGLLPHEILLAFARGDKFIERSVNPITKEVIEHEVFPDGAMRLQAANMAAPYFAPKLAQVQHKGSIARSADQVSDEDLIKVALPTGDGDDG